MKAKFSSLDGIRYWFLCMTVIHFSSCIETLPIVPSTDEEEKFFIECELLVGQHCEAYVSLTEYINKGNNQTAIPDSDQVFLTIGEIQKEIRVPFLYYDDYKSYMIFDLDFQIQPQKFYAITAKLKDSPYELKGMIEVPQVFKYDSISTINMSSQQIGANRWRLSGSVRIHFDRHLLDSDQFLHISIEDSLMNVIPSQPVQLGGTWHKLTHRPGYLCKIERGEDLSYLEFSFVTESEFRMKDIFLSIKNTSSSYYDYQQFKSNSPNQPNHSQNPAIAAFNMSGKAGYGSLMASNEEIVVLTIK